MLNERLLDATQLSRVCGGAPRYGQVDPKALLAAAKNLETWLTKSAEGWGMTLSEIRETLRQKGGREALAARIANMPPNRAFLEGPQL